MSKTDMVVILGPTACGKTDFAAHLALQLGGEIISADSRQVYRGMTIGTGKDLDDYIIDNKHIPYHLIDIVDPGEKYNVYRYQTDFCDAYADVTQRGKLPIMCGGSGLYIEAVLKGYKMLSVPPNPELRAQLAEKSLDELAQILSSYRQLHNNTDTDNRRRAIRSIEIEEYYRQNPEQESAVPPINFTVIGLDIDRDLRREKITRRLKARLDEGLVDEVRSLLDSGISPDDLIYYGLEYKFVTLYAIGHINYNDMYELLNIAIHQFAKRQMTWFRGMERRGIHINWLDAAQPMETKIAEARRILGIEN
ncbi:MAG: tRNA (adenosine(37)-N6)-dimethylallyltransferase MiaA [Bacteroidales bacterium]|nr:tRNA (adenosine(37)-N6)-dimethylallyltransferase MiaA [Bacteroidales bacterium]